MSIKNLEQRIRAHYTREDHPSVFGLLDELKRSEYEWQVLRVTCDAHIVVIEDGLEDIVHLRAAIEDALFHLKYATPRARNGPCIQATGLLRKALENPNE